MGILVLGHKEHGKGTFSELLTKYHDLKSLSSSAFCVAEVIFPALAPLYGYETHEECFADRGNHRAEWYSLIREYNNPDLTKLATSLLKTHFVYDGMRHNKEFEACMKANLFSVVYWVDASDRQPLEGPESFSISFDEKSMVYVDNNQDTPAHMEELVSSRFFSLPWAEDLLTHSLLV